MRLSRVPICPFKRQACAEWHNYYRNQNNMSSSWCISETASEITTAAVVVPPRAALVSKQVAYALLSAGYDHAHALQQQWLNAPSSPWADALALDVRGAAHTIRHVMLSPPGQTP